MSIHYSLEHADVNIVRLVEVIVDVDVQDCLRQDLGDEADFSF